MECCHVPESRHSTPQMYCQDSRLTVQVTNLIAEKPVPDFDRRFVNFLREGLKKLSDHPLQLWLILLALNCLFLPYQDRTHDAILYRAQAENTIENGKFQSDLFFRYGSQDNYSIFSMVVAPVAKDRIRASKYDGFSARRNLRPRSL